MADGQHLNNNTTGSGIQPLPVTVRWVRRTLHQRSGRPDPSWDRCSAYLLPPSKVTTGQYMPEAAKKRSKSGGLSKKPASLTREAGFLMADGQLTA